MDNQRLLVWAAFGMLAFMTYQAWLQDYAPAPAPEIVAPDTATPLTTDQGSADALPGLPSASEESGVPTLPAERVTSSQPAEVAVDAGEVIRVRTDVFEIEINTAGGRIQRASLNNYPVAKDNPDVLLSC